MFYICHLFKINPQETPVVALLGKHSIVLCNRELQQLCSVQETVKVLCLFCVRNCFELLVQRLRARLGTRAVACSCTRR
jgi:hypothetical protein